MEHPSITLTVNGLDEHDLLKNGFYRDGYNGDTPHISYLCYKFVNRVVKRVTIVENVFLTMAKQSRRELYVFKAVFTEDSMRYCNDAIIRFSTGQHLHGVMTIRQALFKIRQHDKTFDKFGLMKAIEDYNMDFDAEEHVFRYGSKEYISKVVVESVIDYIDFSKFCENER